MKYAVDDHLILSRVPEGPLAPYLDRFAASLSEQGYTQRYLHRQVMLAACFSRWLKWASVPLHCVTSDHPTRYLRYRHRWRRPHQEDFAILGHFIDYLQGERVIPAEKVAERRLTPAEQEVQAYEQYLRQTRGLVEASIHNYAPFIRSFLKDRFGEGPVTLSDLSAQDIIRFVQRQAKQLHITRAKLLTTALRSFLHYTRYRGDSELDLAAAVPVVAGWWMSSIPRGIAAEHVRQLLASIDRSTAIGRRDYAIVLLLARLGLRASEVVLLELDDIDWRAATLLVHGKSGQRNGLPLPAEVGRAIADYLCEGRPHSTSRRVFLRSKAPMGGFQGPAGLDSIIRHRLKCAGIQATTNGAHQFRHGLVSEMLHRGASLHEIGELLGHQSPETTRLYTKVHLDALRTLALPWPGGVR